MRENVCIQEFVGEESYVDELGIDGMKILKLIFKKQVVVWILILILLTWRTW